MRTTIDLPEDLHRIASAIARDSGTTLSETIRRLLSTALETPSPVRVLTSEKTGLRVISVGHPLTSEDVRAMDDDE